MYVHFFNNQLLQNKVVIKNKLMVEGQVGLVVIIDRMFIYQNTSTSMRYSWVETKESQKVRSK